LQFVGNLLFDGSSELNTLNSLQAKKDSILLVNRFAGQNSDLMKKGRIAKQLNTKSAK
jgi:hypothetical protein